MKSIRKSALERLLKSSDEGQNKSVISILVSRVGKRVGNDVENIDIPCVCNACESLGGNQGK
jgi:hypothetical protein